MCGMKSCPDLGTRNVGHTDVLRYQSFRNTNYITRQQLYNFKYYQKLVLRAVKVKHDPEHLINE